MKKSELKNLLRGIVQELVQEEIQESLQNGLLSNIITEVASGLSQSNQVIVENMMKMREEDSRKEENKVANRFRFAMNDDNTKNKTTLDDGTRDTLRQTKKKLLEAIGKSSFKDNKNLGGVDIFENIDRTIPSEASNNGNPANPLKNIAPDDPRELI